MKINLKKIKEVLNHPLLSPLVDPVRETVMFGYRLIEKDYIKEPKEAYESTKKYSKDKNPLVAAWQRMFSFHCSTSAHISNMFGTVTTCLAGAFAGGFMASGIATGVLGMIAGGAIGLVSGPFIMGAIGFAGATTIGVFVGGIPALAKSTIKIAKHIKDPGAYAASLQPPPPAVTATPAPDPEPVRHYSAEELKQGIAALPEVDRQKLLAQLEETHQTTFDALRDKKITEDFSRGADRQIETTIIPEIRKKKVNLPSHPGKKTA